jgi:hypothetical protein
MKYMVSTSRITVAALHNYSMMMMNTKNLTISLPTKKKNASLHAPFSQRIGIQIDA